MALALLARRNPEEWSEKRTLEHTGRVVEERRIILVPSPTVVPALPRGVQEPEALEARIGAARDVRALPAGRKNEEKQEA